MGLIRTLAAVTAAAVALVLLLPVVLLVLPFWVVSALTRAISRMLEPKFLTRNQLIKFDPLLGWKAHPNLDTHHLMVDLFHIRTDANGFRGSTTIEESDILVFGDSFAAGYGVSEEHFFAHLTSGVKIKPIGIGGYSMVQEFLQMQQLRSRLGSKLVVWFIYYGNDLFDNLMPDLRGYRKPFLREDALGNWEIVSSHVTAEKWPIVTQGRMLGENHLPKLGELCSDTFLARRAYSACEHIMREGRQLCEEAGADLWVLGIPDALQLHHDGQKRLEAMAGEPPSFDPNLPDNKIEAICQRLGVGFIAGRTFLDVTCYKANDCHWNEKGHVKVSQALVRLKQENPVPGFSTRPSVAPALVEV